MHQHVPNRRWLDDVLGLTPSAFPRSTEVPIVWFVGGCGPVNRPISQKFFCSEYAEFGPVLFTSLTCHGELVGGLFVNYFG